MKASVKASASILTGTVLFVYRLGFYRSACDISGG